MQVTLGFELAAAGAVAVRELAPSPAVISVQSLGIAIAAGVSRGIGYALGGTLNRVGAVRDASVRSFVLAYWSFKQTGDWTSSQDDATRKTHVAWLRLLASDGSNRPVAKTASKALIAIAMNRT
jgi:hypothetical protein